MKHLLALAPLALLPALWSSPALRFPPEPRAPAQEAGARAAPSLLQPPSLLGAVPADAVLFVSLTDLAGMQADAEQNAWCRLLGDAQMRTLWGFLRERAEQAKENLEVLRELPLLWKSMQGEAACFLAGDLNDPEVGFLVRPGPGWEDFEQVREKLVGPRGARGTIEEHGGVALWFHGDGEGELGTVVECELDGVWCLARAATREAALELIGGAIERLRAPSEEAAGMQASPLLAAARAGSFPGRVEFFGDLTRLLAALPAPEDGSEEELQRALELLGVPEITWVHGALDLGPGEAFDLHLRVPTPADGYLADWLAALGPLPRHLAALGPPDAIETGLYNVDVFALYESMWDLFADLDQEAYDQARAGFEGVLQQLGGLDPEGDLLAQLSGELAAFALAVPEDEFAAMNGLLGLGGAPELPPELRSGRVYVTGLEDAEGVELFLEELLEALGPMLGLGAGDIASEDFGGFSLRSLELPMGLTLWWCFTDEHLITSLYPSALRSVLELHGQEDAASLLTSELFAPHLERHAGASMLGLAPSRTTARMALRALEWFSEMGPDDSWDNREEGEETSWSFAGAPVPDGSLAERYLKGTLISKLEHAARVLELSFMAR